MASEEPLTGTREHQELNPDDQLLTDSELFEKYLMNHASGAISGLMSGP